MKKEVRSQKSEVRRKQPFIVYLVTLSLVTLLPIFGFAQQVTDLRINEIFINNEDNFIDEYGRHVPWVEIINTSYNSVNIQDCYLTNDTSGLSSKNPKDKAHWYKIPKGDPNTLIQQRGFLVFFLDNEPKLGTFHTNFNPKDSLANDYIALINSNGRQLVHIFRYPDSLKNAKYPYGYFVDFGPETIERNETEIPNLGILEYFTPGSTNDHEKKITKSELIKEKDEYGIGLAIIAMSVVFVALFTIFLMLVGFGKFANKVKIGGSSHGHGHGHGHGHSQPVAAAPKAKVAPQTGLINSEELAAITVALHTYSLSSRDEESEIITIETPSARYSPWAQKGLVVRKFSKK